MTKEDLETVIKLADNAFYSSTKYTDKVIKLLSDWTGIGFVIIIAWLVWLTIKLK